MKDYLPSGYQIINISISGNLKLLDSDCNIVSGLKDDEITLAELVREFIFTGKIKKPIILNCYDTETDTSICGFLHAEYVPQDTENTFLSIDGCGITLESITIQPVMDSGTFVGIYIYANEL